MKSVEQGKAEMQITKLEIKNYRGIEDLTIKLDSTTVLIGENNTGKTTVLHALRACLQTIRSSGRSQVFDEFDFHLDSESADPARSEEHTSELQSRGHLVCRLLLEKKKSK